MQAAGVLRKHAAGRAQHSEQRDQPNHTNTELHSYSRERCKFMR